MRRGLSFPLLFAMAMVPYAANGYTEKQLIDMGLRDRRQPKIEKRAVKAEKKISKKQKSLPKRTAEKKSAVSKKKKQPMNKKQRMGWGNWLMKKLTFQE